MPYALCDKPYIQSLVWLKNDLRTFDHAAFEAALQQSSQVAAVYIDDVQDPWKPGSASRWWLHYALKDLKSSLEKKNIPLILMKGTFSECLEELISNLKAQSLFYQSSIEPYIRDQETLIHEKLGHLCDIHALPFDLLHDPRSTSPAKGSFYQVFTPFFKRLQTLDIKAPTGEIPEAKASWSLPIDTGCSLESLDLLPKISWDSGFYTHWDPTESGGWKKAKHWLSADVDTYEQSRNFPSREGVSKLSPYLHFGQISPRQLLFAAQRRSKDLSITTSYMRQIVWREFAYHLLWHCPHTPRQPLRSHFENFAWKSCPKELQAWQKGLTGYPIVDAAMRQLWQTGWMHNRLRMIVGSFLVKNLLISWEKGASWFWDTLVDADLANNTLGWQWIAGCGADAAPYFRIFNPQTQSENFDPEGHFIRRFVPELKDAKTNWLHAPWNFETELKQAGITLGVDYPKPIVDHAKARVRALLAYEKIKQTSV